MLTFFFACTLQMRKTWQCTSPCSVVFLSSCSCCIERRTFNYTTSTTCGVPYMEPALFQLHNLNDVRRPQHGTCAVFLALFLGMPFLNVMAVSRSAVWIADSAVSLNEWMKPVD